MDQKRHRQGHATPSGGRKLARAQDPRNPASKPHATTQDQVANMESEGQAQQPGQEPPAEVRDDLAKMTRRKKKG